METSNAPVDVNELIAKIESKVRYGRAGENGSNRPHSGRLQDLHSGPAFRPAAIHLKPLPTGPTFTSKREGYHLTDLLQYADRDFITNAYLAVLGRSPDPAGLGNFLHSLRSGKFNKIEILGRLRYSPEGRARSIKIKGLLLIFLIQSSYRIPVLGYFCRLTTALVQLPTIVKNFQRLQAHTEESFCSFSRNYNQSLFAIQDRINQNTQALHAAGESLARLQESPGRKADAGLLQLLQAAHAELES